MTFTSVLTSIAFGLLCGAIVSVFYRVVSRDRTNLNGRTIKIFVASTLVVAFVHFVKTLPGFGTF
jgi:NhaP-type Na+/H+ or K+/H+ antiporter